MAEEVQTAYTLEIQGVIGVEEGTPREKVEEVLGNVQNVSITIEGFTMYHPDGVDLIYLDMEDDDG